MAPFVGLPRLFPGLSTHWDRARLLPARFFLRSHLGQNRSPPPSFPTFAPRLFPLARCYERVTKRLVATIVSLMLRRTCYRGFFETWTDTLDRVHCWQILEQNLGKVSPSFLIFFRFEFLFKFSIIFDTKCNINRECLASSSMQKIKNDTEIILIILNSEIIEIE